MSYFGILALPTRLDHARNFAGQRELPETDPAQIELAQKPARPAAAETAVAMPDWPASDVLFAFWPCELSSLAIFAVVAIQFSLSSLLLPERHAHVLQQRQTLGVGLGRGGDGNIHALDLFHFVVVDLGKNQLILDAQRVIAAPVERLATTRRGNRARAAAPRSSADPEIRTCGRRAASPWQPIAMPSRSLNAAIDFLALVITGFCPAICAQLVHRAVHQLGVLRGFAQPDIDRRPSRSSARPSRSCSRTPWSAPGPRFS